MNYKEMNDAELSARVWCKKNNCTFRRIVNQGVVEVYDGSFDCVAYLSFPTLSWSDMGPIIEKNRIGLHPNDDGSYKAFTMVEDSDYIASEFNEDSPLRAAAICYLEMD